MSDLPPDPFPVQPAGKGRRVRKADGWHIELDTEVVPLNLDGPDLAEWCGSCLLPSGLGFRFRILVGGAPIATTLTLVICRDCGTTTRRTST